MRLRRNTALRVTLLVGWITGILLPMYSLRRFSSSFRTAFDRAFQTPASHVLMHLLLYAVLAAILASFLPRAIRSGWRGNLMVMTTIAVVAGLQETIQLASKQRAFGSAEAFDFLVDLGGAMLGLLAFSLASRCMARRAESHLRQ